MRFLILAKGARSNLDYPIICEGIEDFLKNWTEYKKNSEFVNLRAFMIQLLGEEDIKCLVGFA